MTTSIDRKVLDRAKGLIDMVGEAMQNASASLAGISVTEDFKALHDAALVEVNLPEVSDALDAALSYIADGWTQIKDNEVRLYEVFLFVRAYRKFAEAVRAFDDVCNGSPIIAEVFTDAMAAGEYYLLVTKYDQLLRPVLNASEDRFGKDAGSRFTGLAAALHSYVRRADDAVLEGIVTGTAMPERKLRWTGPLNEATLLGKHFGLSCKWMNDCFEFRGKDGRPVSLNYTHNRLNNDVKEYPIFDILVKFSLAK